MQLHIDVVLQPVPDLHISLLVLKTFTGVIPCSTFSHQSLLPATFLHSALTQALQSSPVTLMGFFVTAHTIYLNKSKYRKKNGKYSVSEADTIRYPRLRLVSWLHKQDPEIMILSTQLSTFALQDGSCQYARWKQESVSAFRVQFHKVLVLAKRQLMFPAAHSTLTFPSPPPPLPFTNVSLWAVL